MNEYLLARVLNGDAKGTGIVELKGDKSSIPSLWVNQSNQSCRYIEIVSS